ncbi:MAG: T9SS type A sorting domain-containing protein [Ignavibacteria bacterium]
MTNSQVNPEWVRTFDIKNGTGDSGSDLAIDNAGNIFLVGTSDGYAIVMKYSPDGNLIWNKRDLVNVSGYCIDLDINGNVYVYGSDGSSQSRIAKYTNNGTLIWNQLILNSGSNTCDIEVDNNGNLYFLRLLNGCILSKYNSNGNFVWTRQFLGSGSSSFSYSVNKSLKIDNANNIYVTCTSHNPNTDNDLVNIKYNANGDSLWTRVFDYQNGSYENGFCNQLDESSNIYASCISRIPNNQYLTIVLKYGTNGNLLWNSSSGGVLYGATDLIYKNGYVYVNGPFCVSGLGCSPITKYNSNGTLIWTAYYNEPNPQYFESQFLAVDDFDNLYSIGPYRINSTLIDIAGIKYNSNGFKLWNFKYENLSNGIDFPYDAKINDNKLIVLGQTYNQPTNSDILLMKFRSDPIGIIKQDEFIPSKFSLNQNYPNPFNPSTSITFSIPAKEKEEIFLLQVFDVSGKLIETLVNKPINPGNYKVDFNALNLSSGIYFYHLSSNSFSQTRKMLLVK